MAKKKTTKKKATKRYHIVCNKWTEVDFGKKEVIYEAHLIYGPLDKKKSIESQSLCVVATREVSARYKNKLYRYETHCDDLPSELKGKGYGIKLYAGLIKYVKKHGHRISSSCSTSDEAARVWTSQRLSKKYIIKYSDNRWYVLRKRPVRK